MMRLRFMTASRAYLDLVLERRTKSEGDELEEAERRIADKGLEGDDVRLDLPAKRGSVNE